MNNDEVLLMEKNKLIAIFEKYYPKNSYGDLELGGSSCVFSLNRVIEIIEEYFEEGDSDG